MIEFELSDLTKELIVVDMLKYYWKNKHNEGFDKTKIERALKKIEEAEPYYYKCLEFLYLNNWSVTKACFQLYCSERTLKRKKKKLLLIIYNEIMAGINFPAIFFCLSSSKILTHNRKILNPNPPFLSKILTPYIIL